MKKFLFILIIFLSLSVTSAQSAKVTSISFGIPSSVNTEESLDIVVNADTQGVLINAIELVIDYNENLLSFAGYSDDDAVVKIWIDPPHAAEGKIYLSGIVPGGVSGLYDAKKEALSALPLVHLFFVAKKVGNANFSFVDSKILMHDGEGTPLSHEKLSAGVIIKSNPNKEITNMTEQEIPKENPPILPNYFDPTFWIIILVLFLGVVMFNLLKYLYEKLHK